MSPRCSLLPRLPSLLALAIALAMPARAAGQAEAPATAPADRAVRDLPLDAEQRKAYIGSYLVMRPDGQRVTFVVFDQDGALRGRPEGEGEESRRLLYQGDRVFRPEGVPDFVFTFAVKDGRATGFTAFRAGEVMEGIRTP